MPTFELQYIPGSKRGHANNLLYNYKTRMPKFAKCDTIVEFNIMNNTNSGQRP